MQAAAARPEHNCGIDSNLDLHLVIDDRNILAYLAQFGDDETKAEKAMEALKVGVIAIQSASPSLDTQVVQAKFAEVDARIREYCGDFEKALATALTRYFDKDGGVVPRSIDGALSEKGVLSQTLRAYFDGTGGKLSQLMLAQIGPQSTFAKALDPQNKQGVLSVIEARVKELVEAKLDHVLKQFSLDEDGSGDVSAEHDADERILAA